uniref:Uncharacterized protein n=1 Tax=Lutzomyia longipalpis TaxID=7200 RepID=A0A1B0CRC8_LUTLO
MENSDGKVGEGSKRDHPAELPMSARTARQIYKLSMVAIARNAAQEAERKDPATKPSCTRCLMIAIGIAFLPNHIASMGMVEIPSERVTFDDPETEKLPPVDISIKDYASTLISSIILGCSEQPTTPLEVDARPMQLIKDRTYHQSRTVKPLGEHKCTGLTKKVDPERGTMILKYEPTTKLPPSIDLGKGIPLNNPEPQTISKTIIQKSLHINKMKASSSNPQHVVIFAPIGFGKTTLQHRLMQQGIAIPDTDDIPCITQQQFRDMLQWTSILTNRLDLLAKDMPIVACVPATVEVLRKRMTPVHPDFLDDADIDYFMELMNFEDYPQVVKLRTQNRYLSDWFEEAADVVQGSAATCDAPTAATAFVEEVLKKAKLFADTVFHKPR